MIMTKGHLLGFAAVTALMLSAAAPSFAKGGGHGGGHGGHGGGHHGGHASGHGHHVGHVGHATRRPMSRVTCITMPVSHITRADTSRPTTPMLTTTPVGTTVLGITELGTITAGETDWPTVIAAGRGRVGLTDVPVGGDGAMALGTSATGAERLPATCPMATVWPIPPTITSTTTT